MKHKLLTAILGASAVVAFNCTPANAQGTIYTLAGTGVPGFSGDGGPAALAQFYSPAGVAVDGSGNIFVADYYNHRIRMISAAGTVSTVAGTGAYGYAGMGGPAASAGMEYPNSMFVDAAGNYYMTDYFADCAYGVTRSTGEITNICGHNSQGCDGDGGDAPAARMEIPKQVWKDMAGNTYLADYGNTRIRVIDATTGIVRTLTGAAGHGFSPDGTLAASCKWGSITGVCVDYLGNIYVSDGSNHVVRRISTSGVVATVAGTGASGFTGDGGPALSAELRAPEALFVSNAGYLFICDPASNVVRVMNVFVPGSIIETLAGTGTMGFSGDGHLANAAELNQPTGVWEDAAGVIYIADKGNNRIRAIVRSGYRSGATGISGTAAGDVSIFPDPSNGTFTIIGTSLPENTTVEVFNVTGQKVYGQVLSQQHATITLDQPAGVYQVVLRSATQMITRQMVIAK